VIKIHISFILSIPFWPFVALGCICSLIWEYFKIGWRVPREKD
jgi:prepilin signal peptidase PulO-like enzyme (type II secretory pathway)